MRSSKVTRQPASARADGKSGAAELDLGAVLGFMQELWALDHALSSASKRMRTRIQVTGRQRLVLRIVGHSEGISAGDIARALRMDPSTLTGVLARLSERGFLRRWADRRDGRVAHFALTARGRAIDTVRAGTVEAAVRRTLARVPDRQVTAARAVLETLVEELSGIRRASGTITNEG